MNTTINFYDFREKFDWNLIDCCKSVTIFRALSWFTHQYFVCLFVFNVSVEKQEFGASWSTILLTKLNIYTFKCVKDLIILLNILKFHIWGHDWYRYLRWLKGKQCAVNGIWNCNLKNNMCEVQKSLQIELIISKLQNKSQLLLAVWNIFTPKFTISQYQDYSRK